MKRLLSTVAAFALAVGVGYAQAPNRAAVEKQIIADENAINMAFMKKDAATFKKMVAPDGWGIDATGIVTMDGYIKQMNQMNIENFKIDSSKFLWVDNNTVVHTYRWSGKATMDGEPVPVPAYASTMWTNRGGKWVPVFHQETTAAPPTPAKKK